jgi:two-component sensor histidine kinase
MDSLLQIAESGNTMQAARAYKDLALHSPQDSLARHLYFAKKGLKIARDLGNLQTAGNLYMNMGVAYDIADQFAEAIAHYDTAQIFFQQLDNVDDWLASLNINYGAANYYAGYKNLALEYWLKALEKIDPNANNVNYGYLLNNISTSYEALGKYQDAIEYLEKSVALKSTATDKIPYYNGLTNLAQLHGILKRDSIALHLLDEAEQGFRNLGEGLSATNACIYRAKVHLDAGRVDAAADIIFPLVRDTMPLHRASRRIEGFKVAGDVCLALGRPEEASRYYNTARYIMDGSGVTVNKVPILQSAAEAFFQSDKPTLAYQTLRSGLAEMAGTIEKDQLLLEQEMQVKFNTLQKEQENLQLQKENDLQFLLIQKTRRTLILTLLVLLAITALTVQIFMNRRKVKKLNHGLEVQKEIISKSLFEKEILLKEIHHRVKNNLQVISSLLGIQSRQVKDAAVLDAIREGRARVQTMSLIHQNLYGKDNLTGIGINNYFNKLSQSLFETYALSKDDIRLTADIADLVLDIDTVVPLGLMLNELMTNALKYAFPSGSGDIHVKIYESNEGLVLSVRDNGIGIDHPDKVRDGDSFGFDLIHSFVEKLDGALEITVDHGTEIRATLKNYQKAA